jgi:hypothetical protein
MNKIDHGKHFTWTVEKSRRERKIWLISRFFSLLLNQRETKPRSIEVRGIPGAQKRGTWGTRHKSRNGWARCCTWTLNPPCPAHRVLRDGRGSTNLKRANSEPLAPPQVASGRGCRQSPGQ